MMKKFLLVVCGSFVGVILALTFFVISAIITSIAMMIVLNFLIYKTSYLDFTKSYQANDTNMIHSSTPESVFSYRDML